jgi:TonB family protein
MNGSLLRFRLLPLLAALLWAPAPGFSQAAPAAPPAETRAQVLKRADDLITASKFAEAEPEIRRAEGLPGGPCGECALDLAMVRASEGKWGDSADLLLRALPLLTDPQLLARAHNQLGMAYAQGAGGDDRLQKAEDALRDAIDDGGEGGAKGGPWSEIARRNLAQVLLMKGSYAESAETAREALARAGNDKEAARALRIILCQARSQVPADLQTQEPPRKPEGEVTKPQRIAGPNPQYTADARAAKTAGAVVLSGVIDTEGCLRDLKVVQGLPNGLSEAALKAASLWVFNPATLGGQPVPVQYTLSINFKAD